MVMTELAVSERQIQKPTQGERDRKRHREVFFNRMPANVKGIDRT